ncbi:hypothetical protein GOEFS_106_00440 [Gordonia effusa NBRC 100432]|uniref:Uncharacterized protein n=1 Tax=Gordonia effusa NBRC 100432 TaxID=1077974 RepID=H0R4Z7_9ACTN|nr:hypothetical protein [Gordonia effusa]GAB20148.1 hypothetical protein GOEFS_106_00440 [Gordonia effusa NBRC 100432]
MSRVAKFLSSALAVGALCVVAAGCGSEEQATDSSTTTSAPSAQTTTSSTAASTVGGRKPAPPPSSIPAERQTPVVAGAQCGLTKGPDGALTIVILDGKVTCDTAKKIAGEYGPKIATGTNQTVSGWDCGPTQTAGVLAKCVKGDDAFGLVAK